MSDAPETDPRTSSDGARSEQHHWAATVRHVLLFGGSIQGAVVLAAVAEEVGVGLPLFRPVFAVLLLSLVPGLLVLSLLGVREQPSVSLALYAIGASMVTMMAVGVASSFIYPTVGIDRPISEPWVVGTVALVNLLLGGAVAWRADFEAVVATVSVPRPTPAALLSLSLPFIGVLAVAVLNRFETNAVAIGFVLVVAIVPALALSRHVGTENYPLLIWGGALSLLYYKSLWQGSYPLEMWMHGMVLEQGRWVPIIGGDLAALPDIRGMGMESVLTDAVLYPMYALTAGIDTMTQLEVVNPLFVAMIPVAMYEIFRRYVHERDAMLAVFVFVFTFRFYSQHYPNAPRDVMATLFLVLFGLLIADAHINRNARGILAPVFIAGIGVSHYGAAYVVLASLFLSVVLLIGLDVVKRRPRVTQINVRTLTDGGSSDVITYPLVFLAAVFILMWYLFTAGGLKYQILSKAIARMLEPVAVSGLASERVLSQKPFSVETTRKMMVTVFALAGVGVVTEGIRRVVGMRSLVSDEHLSITVGLMAVFALSFLSVGTGFGKGRILAITLAFASVFAVLALHNIREVSARLTKRRDALALPRSVVTGVFTASRVRAGWAVFLCAFLLFNTGVIAETVTRDGDYGANAILNNERLGESDDPELRLQSSGCTQCDVRTVVWTLRYGADGPQVYDGGLAGSYYWYGHSVVTRLDDFVSEYLLENHSALYQEEIPPEWSRIDDGSYVMFTSGNHRSGLVFTSDGNSSSLHEARAELARSNKVYTTGRSGVYRFHNATAEQSRDAFSSAERKSNGIINETEGGNPGTIVREPTARSVTVP